ncbi:DUF1883 domain-containing protein [Microbacterium schleiferi]|uniref:DUF1883 domain-containing protein n=1 Tax=Microbacterium schleiferi TaxID=69362 RepID=A0A7S8MZ10_9MICO|nr:DUF1883 domain-containing protein [Microbacterium schleiferi]QPE05513.1 DUF1883 domain-containing protein [Microbacterium schleiferi]
MNFLKYDLGNVEKGSMVVVTLSTGANVRLMDSANFNSYRQGRRHRFYGGLAKVSPSRIVVPSTRHWYVTIDLAGLRASSVRASVNVEPGALRPLRSADGSLAGIRTEPPVRLTPDESGQTWDVFISHAGEDKASVALPLYKALTERGLKVWLDKGELSIGDSLRRKIDYGLAHSSFGVVVFSKSFFAKGWPQYELDGIVGMSIAGKQRMLPIWHEISKDEIESQSPSLADKIARTTATSTIAEIADEIVQVVRDVDAT